eukprot:TRINITY_DN2951_c0_g1_i1.p1 TRINITY_DN2951_c0_g1~~TRINITY_DN2951_c0_g1_i1.p1  ORF type:complete len:316 (-),score=31.26 TRINITY_DN2951_c0_g1_i1:375-1322(-)
MHKLLVGAFFAVGAITEIFVKKRRKEQNLTRKSVVTRSLQPLPGQSYHHQQQQQQQYQNNQSQQQAQQYTFISTIPPSLQPSVTYMLMLIRLIQLIICYFVVNGVKSDSKSSFAHVWGQVILFGVLELLCWQNTRFFQSFGKIQSHQVVVQEEELDREELERQLQKQRLRSSLTGTWIKDFERSDSMDKALDLMEMGGIVRTAVRLIRGVQIKLTEKEFVFSLFSIIPWFKITERYPTDGETRRYRRRDLRPGKHVGYIEEKQSKIVTRVVWSDPFGGNSMDILSCPSDDELQIESHLNVGGKSVSFTSIYRKQH